MKLRVQFTVYNKVGAVLSGPERFLIEPDDAGTLEQLAAEHLALLVENPGFVEVEFLDELDPLQRFFRIGTDPSRMIAPIAIQISEQGTGRMKKGARTAPLRKKV
jgi:hypothetical protein